MSRIRRCGRGLLTNATAVAPIPPNGTGVFPEDTGSLGFKTCAAESGRHGLFCIPACYYILESGTRIACSNVAADTVRPLAHSLVRSRSYCTVGSYGHICRAGRDRPPDVTSRPLTRTVNEYSCRDRIVSQLTPSTPTDCRSSHNHSG